jgi:hypothetical protein
MLCSCASSRTSVMASSASEPAPSAETNS